MKPSIGRVLWYCPENHPRDGTGQPLVSLIAFIHPEVGDDRDYVNLAVFAQDGSPLPRGVQVVPVYSLDEVFPEREAFASWIPYQAAAKSEETPLGKPAIPADPVDKPF